MNLRLFDPMSLTRLLSSAHRSGSTRNFRLQRYFSLTSLLGLVVVTLALLWTYRELTLRHLIEHESRANAQLTQALSNVIWERYRPWLLAAGQRPMIELKSDPELARLDADVISRLKHLHVVKLKIFSPAGQTIYSTDHAQLGEDKSTNAGFRSALAGEVASQLTFRERFDAFEGVISQRNLISSYVPVRGPGQAGTEGVIEVYSDVTDMLDQQNRAQWQVAGVVLGLLALLYGFLHLVVAKADRILARQDDERATKEAQVRHQAYHDALTGLPNRAYFAERLQEALTQAGRDQRACGLLFVDLDRFKIVNDSLGHQAGDALLKAVAERVQGCLRATDLLFRMGGDEFTLILPQLASADEAALIARRVNEAVALPIPVMEHQLHVGATIGIALYPDDGDSAETLLKNADAAMYSAKEGGRGGHAFYRSAMNQRASARLELEMALKKGFRDGEFTLFYQPRLDAGSRRIVGMEALLRWFSPTRGRVLPGEFIAVLEDCGMMPMVGEWVLRKACAQLRSWIDQGLQPVRVSVNVSSVQFESPSFVSTVQRVLSDTVVPAQLLELELTESMLIAQPQQARDTVAALRRIGVQVSIDDFGTGYSSLNYLRHMAVDTLKIDRSFVMDVAHDERDRSLVTAIIQMAKALGISVVAEGVETEAQAEFFRDARCEEMQGYLFARPLPADEAATRLVRTVGTASTDLQVSNQDSPAQAVGI